MEKNIDLFDRNFVFNSRRIEKIAQLVGRSRGRTCVEEFWRVHKKCKRAKKRRWGTRICWVKERAEARAPIGIYTCYWSPRGEGWGARPLVSAPSRSLCTLACPPREQNTEAARTASCTIEHRPPDDRKSKDGIRYRFHVARTRADSLHEKKKKPIVLTVQPDIESTESSGWHRTSQRGHWPKTTPGCFALHFLCMERARVSWSSSEGHLDHLLWHIWPWQALPLIWSYKILHIFTSGSDSQPLPGSSS